MLSETNFEWKQSADAQPEDEWLAQFDDKRKTAAVTTTTPDWLSALDDSVDPVENLDMPDTDDLTWLSNEVPQSGGARDAAASSPDSIPGGADEEFTWMSDFDEIEAAPTEAPITPAHVPDWLTELQPAEEDADQPPAPGNDDLDWMAAFDEPVASTDNGSGSNDEPEDDDDAFTWLEDAADVGSALPAANAVPDWMSELAPGEQALSSLEKDEDELDWMSAFDQADGDQAEAAQPEFDWMNEVPSENANSNTAADVETAEDDPFAWMLDAEASGLPVTSAPVTDSEFADLVNAEDDLESALTPDANAPDWLSELAPAAAAQFAVEPQINPAEVPDWLTELEPAVEAEVEAPAESLAVSSAAILEQDEFEWMDAIASEEADDEAEFAAEDAEFVVDPVAAVPDWLSELEPEADADFPAEPAAVTSSAAVLGADEFAWMDAIASEEADDEAEFAVDPVAQVPDWLTELEPEADAETPHEPAAAVVGADEFAWMSAIPVDDGVEDEEFAVEPVADVPDWLSELEPEAEDQEPVAESDAVPVVGQDDLEWMSDFDEMADEPETEDAPIRVQSAAGQDDLEWISALDEPEVELTAEPEANAEPDEEFAWMDEVAAAETADSGVEFVPAAPESAAVAEYIVDGLLPLEAEEWAAPVPEDEMFPVMEEEAQAEAVQQITAGEGHELAVINDSDTFETPADNAPDWLNAMVPGLDVDYAPADEVVEEEPAAEPSSAREFAWLTNIVEEETNANAPSRFSFSKAPAWLQRLIPPAQPAASQSDTDLPDWASDDDADLPEWLR